MRRTMVSSLGKMPTTSVRRLISPLLTHAMSLLRRTLDPRHSIQTAVYTDPWPPFSRAISFNGAYRNVT